MINAGWVAGGTRARTLLRRRLGTDQVRALAAVPELSDAVRTLSRTAYQRAVHVDQDLAEAERAVTETLLWDLRVLAGWQSRQGVDVLRALSGWFEIANTEDRLRGFAGHPTPEPYRLGALSTAWRTLGKADSPTALRARLEASRWGDPGDSSAAAVGLSMRLAWACRVAATVPAATNWAAGAAALLVARQMFRVHPISGPAVKHAARMLGPAALRAASYSDFASCLPATARWAVSGVDDPDLLWQAEPRWWSRVERDAKQFVSRSRFASQVVAGAVALLAADAWRTTGALELAARGGMADHGLAGEEAPDAQA